MSVLFDRKIDRTLIRSDIFWSYFHRKSKTVMINAELCKVSTLPYVSFGIIEITTSCLSVCLNGRINRGCKKGVKWKILSCFKPPWFDRLFTMKILRCDEKLPELIFSCASIKHFLFITRSKSWNKILFWSFHIVVQSILSEGKWFFVKIFLWPNIFCL